MKMKIVGKAAVFFQRTHQEFPQRTPFVHHQKGFVKKFGKDDKINRNILFFGRKDFLRGVLVQEQEITRVQCDLSYL